MSVDLRAAARAEARAWIGTPYVHRASVRRAGADCLGLVRGVWRALRGDEPEAVPAYAPLWAEEGDGARLVEALRRYLSAVDAAEPGDVLAFRMRMDGPVKHLGVMSAPDAMVHAMERRGVVETPLGGWWRQRVAGAFRF